MFQNIVSVDRDEHVITISENLNAVLDDVSPCFCLHVITFRNRVLHGVLCPF